MAVGSLSHLGYLTTGKGLRAFLCVWGALNRVLLLNIIIYIACLWALFLIVLDGARVSTALWLKNQRTLPSSFLVNIILKKGSSGQTAGPQLVLQ